LKSSATFLIDKLPPTVYIHKCTLHTHTHTHSSRYTFILRPALVAVSVAHHFPVSHTCLSSHPSLSLWSFPTCRQLQPPTSSFIIIIIVTDPMNTTHNSRRQCLSGGRKPSLEQSVARHHNSSNFRRFPESTQNVPVLLFILAMTDACTPFSGLSVLLGHYK